MQLYIFLKVKMHRDFNITIFGKFLRNEQTQNGKARLKYSYMVMQDVNFELFADSVEPNVPLATCNPDLDFVNLQWTN